MSYAVQVLQQQQEWRITFETMATKSKPYREDAFMDTAGRCFDQCGNDFGAAASF